MITDSLITLGQSIHAELEAHVTLLFHLAFSNGKVNDYLHRLYQNILHEVRNNAKAPAQAGCHPAGKQPGREGSGGPGQDQAEYVPLLQ